MECGVVLGGYCVVCYDVMLCVVMRCGVVLRGYCVVCYDVVLC